MNLLKPADTNSAVWERADRKNADAAANEIWRRDSWQGLELKEI